MNDAVFISDLHLSPNDPEITERFIQFINWATSNTKAVYILGDFFHAWAGDDLIDSWAKDIADRLSSLTDHNIKVFYLHGNRDFLLGQRFFKLAKMTLLPDPYVLTIKDQQILLTHGDQYCTRDTGHVWLRRLTRNPWFTPLFLTLPKKLRKAIVSGFRANRMNAAPKPSEKLEIVKEDMIQDMVKNHVEIIIHGHIHKPGIHSHQFIDKQYKQYVLSDWDDNPLFLCYHYPHSIKFNRE